MHRFPGILKIPGTSGLEDSRTPNWAGTRLLEGWLRFECKETRRQVAKNHTRVIFEATRVWLGVTPNTTENTVGPQG